jgi:uncharacterized membrane protein (TIGR02234 family)
MAAFPDGGQRQSASGQALACWVTFTQWRQPVTSGGETRSGRARGLLSRSPGQELTLTLLLGAIGAGLVFLASREAWAQVRTIPPRPLPASVVSVTGASLVPYADALVLAGLATLIAVLASRGLLRRLTGVLLAIIGAGLAASALTLSRSGAIAAANDNAGPATATAGSVTGGTSSVSTVPNVAGAAPHVTFAATSWQVMVVAGGVIMIAAGLAVVLRAGRMAVMSSRYDSPAGHSPRPAEGQPRKPADSASMWEALSRGDDPTSGSRPAST